VKLVLAAILFAAAAIATVPANAGGQQTCNTWCSANGRWCTTTCY
jgi:hypothetical protein